MKYLYRLNLMSVIFLLFGCATVNSKESAQTLPPLQFPKGINLKTSLNYEPIPNTLVKPSDTIPSLTPPGSRLYYMQQKAKIAASSQKT